METDKLPFFDRIASLRSKMLNSFFVPRCSVCSSAVWDKDYFLCADCLKIWDSAQKEKCPVCKKRAMSCICRPISMKSTGRVGERYIAALSFYGKPDSTDERDITVRRIVNTLKKSPDRRCVKTLAADLSRIITKKLLTSKTSGEKWVLCSPPRTKSRLRDYGFDQSKQLAKAVSEYTGLSLEDCFENTGRVLQKTLNVVERRRNAGKSYRLKKDFSASGKNYIIIDDIITTGATVSSCAALLYEAGAENVFPVCVARTKPKKRKVRRRRPSEKLWFG